MLALAGVPLDYPIISYDNQGSVDYDSSSQIFALDATPLSFLASASSISRFVIPPRDLVINIQVDNTGALVGGVPGNDFILKGEIDIDGDTMIDASGTLLTGEISQFGFLNVGGTDFYDFRFTTTGGVLATGGSLTGGGTFPAYFSGKDITVFTTSEQSSFTGSFAVDFSGEAKGSVGSADALQQPEAEIHIEKCIQLTAPGLGEMFVVDFDTDDEGNALPKGAIVDDEYADFGLTISAKSNTNPYAGNRAMIFDSSMPTGNDDDLGTPNIDFSGPGIGAGGGIGGAGPNQNALGNILIISEDGDSSDPDDDAHGGTITFTWDDPVRVDYVDLLDIDSNESGGAVVTVIGAGGNQVIAIPALGDNSFQQIPVGVDDVVQMKVKFVSSGAVTEVKFTRPTFEEFCDPADDPPGPSFAAGEEITFKYFVSNPGDVDLTITDIVDDNATPGDAGDDIVPTPVEEGGFNVGDDNMDELLNTNSDEVWVFVATTTADASIDIEKLTNGVNADDPNDAPEIEPGDDVIWTYQVTTDGPGFIPGEEIEIVDDAGTPGHPGDDFSISSDDITFVGGDTNDDGNLDVGETWIYEAMGTAQALTTTGASTTFVMTGGSPLDGPNGNIRTFASGGISLNASAFSRDPGGIWEEAWLGAYSSGLGVTDNSEGDGGDGLHRVDNVVRENYVLFAFSENVVVDRTFLDSVANDSDLSVWIGTIPGAYTNPVTLSDAVLGSLDFNEVNNTDSSYARWADINSAGVAGNVLVLAASVEDHTPDDRFKIKKLDVQESSAGIYKNTAVVTASAQLKNTVEVTATDGQDTVTDDDMANYTVTGLTDIDMSHYTNPVMADPDVDIEKLTNGVNADDPNDAPEIAPGDEVTWTYEVTTNGPGFIPGEDIEIVDDAGTPGHPGDDFSINSDDIMFVGGDTDDDGNLDVGETWIYEAMGTAQDLTTTGASTTFVMTGSSPLDGPNGNMRTFSSGGISLKASAFSRDSGGIWDESWLGAYSGGLGVTDNSEGDGGDGLHRVDNVFRDNYVLFAFSEAVVVDRTFLDSVVNDSDLSVWIGTIPGAFTNPVTLSDAVLSSLELNEVNNTDSSYARWADINSAGVAGNVLVLAASVEDHTPDDRFKIKKLDVQEAGAGIYKNTAVVTTGPGGATDADVSHYTNPEAAAADLMFEAEDFEWDDHPWEVHADPAASGGEYIVAPNRTGSYYNSPPYGKQVKYRFDVAEDGQYVLQALVQAADGSDNSTWIKIDNGNWIQWHADVTGDQWQWQDVSHGWNQDDVKIQLTAGEHTLTVKVREDGTKLDKFRVSKIESQLVVIDAMDYASLRGAWDVYVDDHGNEYLMAENGTGSSYNSPPSGNALTFDFSVQEDGLYQMFGLVSAGNGGDNSFWVAIDGGDWVQWHLTVTGEGIWKWQTVTDGSGQEEVLFDLSAGLHTLKIKVREDGTMLDKIAITNDLSLDPLDL